MTALGWALPAAGQADGAARAFAEKRGPSGSEVSKVSVEGSLESIDELALIERAQEGSEEAFRVLVERYKKRAYWLAYQLVHDEEDARDISQEAFIRVFKSISRYDKRFKFYTWLYKIVTNLAVDQLRKRGDRRRVSIDALGDVTPAVQVSAHKRMEQRELQQRVHQVLELLPPKYKAVMVLRELEGIDAKEIAGIVGSTHATVRWRLHRARQLFRAEWDRLFGDLDPVGDVDEARTDIPQDTLGGRDDADELEEDEA